MRAGPSGPTPRSHGPASAPTAGAGDTATTALAHRAAEDDQPGGTGEQAVDRERGQGPGREPAGQPAHRGVRAEAGDDAAGQHLAVDAGAERAGQVGQLEHAGGQDHRRGQQEGEPGRVLVGQPADQAADHRDPGPADARQQREDLGRADEQRGAEARRRHNRRSAATSASASTVEGGWAGGPAAVAPTADRSFDGGGGTAQPLAEQQDHAVRHQEHRRRGRAAEHRAERVLQQQAADPDRDRGQHDQPGQPLVRRGHPAVPDRGEQAADDPHPVGPEEDQQRQRGRDVQPDDERQVRRLRRGHVQVGAPSARRPAPAAARCARGWRPGTARSRPGRARRRSPPGTSAPRSPRSRRARCPPTGQATSRG